MTPLSMRCEVGSALPVPLGNKLFQWLAHGHAACSTQCLSSMCVPSSHPARCIGFKESKTRFHKQLA
eukprot:CAMPEP_0172757486 /NCGR_PEP_ID=MMETSP1074-20121228/163911_1 /TAXON_ID=2916 /ORGANISM="Ceratium fusus, Strain PA161109" /LENGTH=66 /DNA_ID=CAMNT_0013590917 /DNA_START=204 /DNA_END=401 /DNA_ORIENTATION=+